MRILVLVASILIFVTASVGANSNFVKILLPHNVSIEIPRNWRILSDNTRMTLDSFVEALDLGNISSDLGFAANLYDDAGKTMALVNVRYYPDNTTQQSDIETFDQADIQYFD